MPAMADVEHDDMSAVAEMCLGVFTAVGAAVLAVGFALTALGRWQPAIVHCPLGMVATARPPQPRIRAGPQLAALALRQSALIGS